MEQLPQETGEDQPKYRIIGVEDIAKTQEQLNELHGQGYSLEAISANFMLLVIKEVDPMEGLARMAMAKMAGEQGGAPQLPPGLFAPPSDDDENPFPT